MVLCSLLLFPGIGYGFSVAVPDPILEAAIESGTGDNGIPGIVDGHWLLGQDSDAGVYTDEPGGLVVLGMEEEALFTLEGVTDLTGLEHAHNLRVLLLKSSPVPSLSPLLSLDNLETLAFHSCSLGETHFDELLQATFSLTTFGLVNSPGLPNQVLYTQIKELLQRHPSLRTVALIETGLPIKISDLAGMPRLSDPPCQRELRLRGNAITSLDGLALFYDVTLLDLSRCGITDEVLAQGDWSTLTCIKGTLDLSGNAITNIAPLLGLATAKRAVREIILNLRQNRLDAISMEQYVPTLEQAGCKVLFDMELLLTVEGIGDVSPEPGSTWHPYGASIFRNARPRPDSNQGFLYWQGNGAGTDYGITATMNEHRQYTAVFSKTPAPGRRFYAISILSEGNGNGELLPPRGKSLYRDGETIGLVATPLPGSFFGGWEIFPADVEETSLAAVHINEPFHAVVMNRDWCVKARFITEGHVLTICSTGEGTLSMKPGQYPLAHGATITVRAFPEPGWRVARWEDDSGIPLFAQEDAAGSFCTVVINASCTAHAVFEEAIRTLTVEVENIDGASGCVLVNDEPASLKRSYAYGELLSIRAVPENKDSAFAGWSRDFPEEEAPGNFAPDRTFRLTGDYAIKAAFVPAETRLTIIATLDGASVTGSATGMFPLPGTYGFVRHPDNRVTVEAYLLPNTLVAFAGWAGDLQQGHWSSNFAETVSMDQDRNLTAVLQTQDTCQITVGKRGTGGTIPTPGAYTVVPGRTLPLGVLIPENTCFGGWWIRCQKGAERILLQQEVTVTAPGDVEATAQFGETCHTVWIGASEDGGALTPASGVYTVPNGTLLDLQASPPDNRMFYHWADREGSIISPEPQTRVTVTQDSSYTAVYGVPGFRVHTAISGTGVGQVTVSPGETNVYPAHTVITLCAQPGPDSVFVGWEGNVPETYRHQPTVSLVVQETIHATAVIDKADFYLTVNIEGLSEGREAQINPGIGAFGYLEGTDAVVFAAPPPDSGIAFMGWESSGEQYLHPELRIVMDQDREVVARFAPAEAIDSAQIKVLPPEGDGNGVLIPLSPGTYLFHRGAAISFHCDLPPDSYFGGFRGDFSDEFNYHALLVALTHNQTIGACFTRTGALLSLGLNGAAGGHVQPAPGSYRLSHSLKINVAATRTDIDWTFQGWYDEFNTQISPYGRYRFQLPPDATAMTIIGVFQPRRETTPLEYARKSIFLTDAR
jgi:hypothetical protein